MRAFKREIDALTTRSRFAEAAFLALYKLLREAPDPAVTVQALEKAARAAVGALEWQNRWVWGWRRRLMGVRHIRRELSGAANNRGSTAAVYVRLLPSL